MLSQEELEEYEELTYLSQHQILAVLKRFIELAPETVNASPDVRLPKDVLLKSPDLASNPFRERICMVFSATGDGSMDFDDFLDMMSVFSEHAPKSVKVEYAFRVYDMNDDGRICRKDVRDIVQLLCGDERVWESDKMDKIVGNFFNEADMSDDSELDFPEFENMIAKAPDFVNSFRFRPIH